MFRKKSTKLSPPDPPTFDQILEDLKTFKVEQPEVPKVRSIIPSDEQVQPIFGTGTSQPVSPSPQTTVDIADWWKTFETFLCDINDLNKLKSNLEQAKSDLDIASSLIKSRASIIKNQIQSELDDVKKLEENQI